MGAALHPDAVAGLAIGRRGLAAYDGTLLIQRGGRHG